MKKQRLVIRTIILLILGAAVVYTLYANLTKEKEPTLEVRKEAPDFSLVDLNGEKHKLSEYKGKGVFLNFWGTYCPPCVKEMPYINSQYLEYKDQGVVVLAIAAESELAVKKFTERLPVEIQFPMLLDGNGEVNSVYKIGSLPATFLIDKNGKLVKTYLGGLSEEMVKEFMEQIKP